MGGLYIPLKAIEVTLSGVDPIELGVERYMGTLCRSTKCGYYKEHVKHADVKKQKNESKKKIQGIQAKTQNSLV